MVQLGRQEQVQVSMLCHQKIEDDREGSGEFRLYVASNKHAVLAAGS